MSDNRSNNATRKKNRFRGSRTLQDMVLDGTIGPDSTYQRHATCERNDGSVAQAKVMTRLKT